MPSLHRGERVVRRLRRLLRLVLPASAAMEISAAAINTAAMPSRCLSSLVGANNVMPSTPPSATAVK